MLYGPQQEKKNTSFRFNAIYFYFVLYCTENCMNLYTRQPGHTDKCCNLNGHSPLVLQCQISTSNEKEVLSIRWHYSSSPPDAEQSTTQNYANKDRLSYNITQTLGPPTQSRPYVVTSQLSILGFDDKEVGYYWCSVHNSGISDSVAPNPSAVLFISSRFSTEELQSCTESVHLHNPTLRCADTGASIDVINAQDVSAACGSDGKSTVKATPVEIYETTTDNAKLKRLITTAAVTATAMLTTEGGNHANSTTEGNVYGVSLHRKYYYMNSRESRLGMVVPHPSLISTHLQS